MEPTTVRRRARPWSLICLVGVLAGCNTHPPPPIPDADLRLAQSFPLYTTFWVGRTFHGIDLTAADSKRDYDATVGMRVYYGTCRKPSSILSTSGCQLPLEIATVLYRPHTNEGLGARREAVIRGVPAEIFNGGSSIELYSGHLAIDIYADSPSLARAAAEALVPLNRAPPASRSFAPPRLGAGSDPRVKAIADGLAAAAAAAPAPVARRPRRG